MNDLSHFVPLTETVTIRNQKIKLVGVDLEDLGQLYFRFPEIGNMIQTRTFDVKVLSKQAVAAFIAVGAGKAGDEAAEKAIASLALGERIALFNSVFRLTSPGGIGPFVELMVALTGGVALPGARPAAAPRKKGGVKVRLRP
jgi:hypothetical protein